MKKREIPYYLVTEMIFSNRLWKQKTLFVDSPRRLLASTYRTPIVVGVGVRGARD